MKKIIVFVGSNSSTSITFQLTNWVVKQMNNVSVDFVALNEYTPVLYSQDIERESGFPKELNSLLDRFKAADACLIATNEHNGSWSAYMKNVFDWLSRMDRAFLENKNIFALSCSPGARGGLGSLEQSIRLLPRMGGNVVASSTFPNFATNFNVQTSEVTDGEIKSKLLDQLNVFLKG